MSLFLFLTVVQALVAAALVGIVLIQRSEGGGLGVGGGGGGGPGGLLSARGSADFLTRTTKWLAVVFVWFVLTVLRGHAGRFAVGAVMSASRALVSCRAIACIWRMITSTATGLVEEISSNAA